MSNDEAVELLADAMSREDSSNRIILQAVSRVQQAGLRVRDLYDEAREQTAAKGKYVVSFRELTQDSAARGMSTRSSAD